MKMLINVEEFHPQGTRSHKTVQAIGKEFAIY